MDKTKKDKLDKSSPLRELPLKEVSFDQREKLFNFSKTWSCRDEGLDCVWKNDVCINPYHCGEYRKTN